MKADMEHIYYRLFIGACLVSEVLNSNVFFWKWKHKPQRSDDKLVMVFYIVFGQKLPAIYIISRFKSFVIRVLSINRSRLTEIFF